MRVHSLQCTGVNARHDFDLLFHEDLTFLTGVNGSGKTTALRMLTALITPSVDVLSNIEFESAIARIRGDRGLIDISAQRSQKELVLRVSTEPDELRLPIARRQMRLREELIADCANHPVIRAIESLTFPMFIGIDRRPSARELHLRRDRRRLLARGGDPHFVRVSQKLRDAHERPHGSLADVEVLVEYAKREVLRRQARLDARLRSDLMLSALAPFEFPQLQEIKPPDSEQISKLRAKKISLAQTATNLGLDGEGSELSSRLDAYLDRIEKTLKAMETWAAERRQGWRRMPGRGADGDVAIDVTIDWLFSVAYLERVMALFERVDRYLQQRKEMNEPIVRFESCVNAFYMQTNRRVNIDDDARMLVRVHDRKHVVRDLSSGERQILVLAAHLALDPDLQRGGVFIVDEPEVSLHIAWQQCFVREMMRVGAGVQFIMATHSPAIIMDRDDRCVDLSKGVVYNA